MRIPASLAIGVILAGIAGGARADDLRTISLATDLGTVLASETACGLEFRQDAIAAFIEKKVADDDMSFPSMLQMMTAGAEMDLEDMSPSALTAHCTQIRRVAKSYGFID